MKRVTFLLIALSLFAAVTRAQHPAGDRLPQGAELQITLGKQQVRFAPTRNFLEMRLEVVNSLGETVYSHLTTEAAFNWNLRAGNGDSLAAGLYRYAVTLKLSEEQSITHRGHFIVEKGQDQIWLTANEGAEVSGAALTNTRSGGRSLAGFRIGDDPLVKRDVSGRRLSDENGNQLADQEKPAKQEKSSVSATQNRIAKFAADGVTLVDSAAFESDGNVGIGTTTPTAKLSVNANSGTPPAEFGLIGYFANANENNSFLTADAYGNSNVHSDFLFRRARGTMAAPLAVQTDDIIGQVQARGHTGAGFVPTSRAGIRMTAAQNWTPLAQGAYLSFLTTPNGSNAINVERMRITDAGNVGIGTTAPAAALHVNNGIFLLNPDSTREISLGTPNGEAGSAIKNAGNRADLRFDGNTLKLVATTGLLPPASTNGLNITTSGDVGIGTSTPSTAKLTVNTLGYGLGHTSNSVSMASYIDGSGGWFGTRTNHPLYFYTNNGGAQLSLDTTGNVGIGAIFPAHRLSLGDGPSWTSNAWKGALSMTNSSAIGWGSNNSGQSFGIGQTNGGLYFFRTNSSPGVPLDPANYDLQITDTGNLAQARDKGGLVKAMISVDPFLPANQYIVRCYNGITGSSTGNCGFIVTRSFEGRYLIDFGTQINDRFLSLTLNTFSPRGSCANPFSQNVVEVNVEFSVTTNTADSRFFLVVY